MQKWCLRVKRSECWPCIATRSHENVVAFNLQSQAWTYSGRVCSQVCRVGGSKHMFDMFLLIDIDVLFILFSCVVEQLQVRERHIY